MNFKRAALGLGLVFVVSFMAVFIKNTQVETSEAIGGFEAGNIISNYVMGNYNSMTEGEIQSFLDNMSRCNSSDLYGGYRSGDWYVKGSYNWHLDGDGDFICLNRERFGDDGEIGWGETAAQLIYRLAQEYRINPQVILVLLQKEQGLLTDPYPNNFDYGWALGFGAYDYGDWDTKYAGFKEQVEAAYDFYHWFVYDYDEDYGWWNMSRIHLGWSDILYNPDAGCGSGSVYIENTATVALYVYTPYQPNSSVPKDSFGYGDGCGSYGNRNFSMYFRSYFGDPQSVGFVPLVTPRYFELVESADRINPFTNEIYDKLEKGRQIKFSSKIYVNGNGWCFRTRYNTINDDKACIYQKNLKDIELRYEEIPANEQYKIIKSGAVKKYIRADEQAMMINEDTIRRFVVKTEFNNNIYYITEYDYKNNNSEYGILGEDLKRVPDYEPFKMPRYLKLTETVDRVNPVTGEKYDSLKKGTISKYTSKMDINGEVYYRTEYMTKNNVSAAVPAKYFEELSYEPFKTPRYLKLVETVDRINPVTGERYDSLEKGTVSKYTSKIDINGEVYYRTEYMTKNNVSAAVPAKYFEELSD